MCIQYSFALCGVFRIHTDTLSFASGQDAVIVQYECLISWNPTSDTEWMHWTMLPPAHWLLNLLLQSNIKTWEQSSLYVTLWWFIRQTVVLWRDDVFHQQCAPCRPSGSWSSPPDPWGSCPVHIIDSASPAGGWGTGGTEVRRGMGGRERGSSDPTLRNCSKTCVSVWWFWLIKWLIYLITTSSLSLQLSLAS